MKITKVIVFVTTLLLLTSAGFAQEADSSPVVAKVEGIPITKYELARKVNRIIPLRSSFHKGISEEKFDQVIREAFDDLVLQAYKVKMAIEEEVSVENTALDERIKPLYDKFGTEEKVQEAIGKETIGELRSALYREMLSQKAEKIFVDEKVNIGDDAVLGYYEENPQRFEKPKMYGVSHILIKVDPSSTEEIRQELKAKADDLYQQAIDGADFYNLAYYNSDDDSKYVGGDVGYIHKGRTVKEFEDRLFLMKTGEISEPVETMYGYHIIYLKDVQEPKTMTFEEVKGEIRDRLEKKQRESLYEEWVVGLKARYKYEILSDELKNKMVTE